MTQLEGNFFNTVNSSFLQVSMKTFLQDTDSGEQIHYHWLRSDGSSPTVDRGITSTGRLPGCMGSCMLEALLQPS